MMRTFSLMRIFFPVTQSGCLLYAFNIDHTSFAPFGTAHSALVLAFARDNAP